MQGTSRETASQWIGEKIPIFTHYPGGEQILNE